MKGSRSPPVLVARIKRRRHPDCRLAGPAGAPLGPTATAQTDGSGKFAVTIAGGPTYRITASFAAKDGSNVTVNGFAQVSLVSPLQLGVAHNLVASKLLSTGVTKPN